MIKFVIISCFSAAALAVVATSGINEEADIYREIAMCGSVSLASVSSSRSQEAPTDKEFVLQATEACRTEVALGELAFKKGMSGAVKDFGKMMVDDHTKANNELKVLAEQKGITPPADCNTCKQKLAELENLSAKDFDKKYIEMMIADHQETYDKFSNEAASGKDNELKEWAGAKLATLEHHLTTAQSIH